MRFDIKAFGLTCGILWGLTVFLVTLWLIAFGYQGTFIRNLDHFYFGYSFSLVGSVLGGLLIQSVTTTILSRGVAVELTLIVKAAVVIAVCLLQSERFRRDILLRRLRVTRRAAT